MKDNGKGNGSVAGGRFTSHPSQTREGWGTRNLWSGDSGKARTLAVLAVYIPPIAKCAVDGAPVLVMAVRNEPGFVARLFAEVDGFYA